MSKHKKSKRKLKPGQIPETQSVSYYDPEGLKRKRRQGRALQRRAARLAGPVTLRKIGDPKPDQPDEQEQE